MGTFGSPRMLGRKAPFEKQRRAGIPVGCPPLFGGFLSSRPKGRQGIYHSQQQRQQRQQPQPQPQPQPVSVSSLKALVGTITKLWRSFRARVAVGPDWLPQPQRLREPVERIFWQHIQRKPPNLICGGSSSTQPVYGGFRQDVTGRSLRPGRQRSPGHRG